MEDKQETSCINGGKKIAVFFAVGILLVLVGVTFYPLVDSLIQNKIDSELVLKPGSDSFKQWRSPNIPIYLQFFIFNVINKMEAKEGKPPFLEEIGPYSYREHRRKEQIVWHDSNSTVSYNEKQWFVFDPETSCASCDPNEDIVTTVNIPLVTLAGLVKDYPDILDWKLIITLLFDSFNETLFEERKVQDLLWGYDDPILKEYNKLKREFNMSFLPDVSSKIALQQNNTYQGVTTVYTGASNIDSLVKWVEWKGDKNLRMWNSSYANMINGTDGSQFSPDTSSSDTLYVFVTQLCRSLYMNYDKTSSVHGISTDQFTTPKSLFQNATLNPDNAAFCTKECYPTGILDISVCQNAPITIPLFISAPHFYLGDPSLTRKVEGLNPNKEEHGTFLDVATHLGVPLSSAKRLQINVLIEPIKDIAQTQGLGRLFLPIMYINETATVDKATADMIKTRVLTPFRVAHGIEFAVIILGSLFVLVAVALLARLIHRNRKLKQIKDIIISNRTDEKSPLLVSA